RDLWILGTPPREARQEELNLMMFVAGERKVGKSGIQFNALLYQSACLAGHFGKRVSIRYLPSDRNAIHAYSMENGHYIGIVPWVKSPLYNFEKDLLLRAQKSSVTGFAAHAERAVETIKATRRLLRREADAE